MLEEIIHFKAHCRSRTKQRQYYFTIDGFIFYNDYIKFDEEYYFKIFSIDDGRQIDSFFGHSRKKHGKDHQGYVTINPLKIRKKIIKKDDEYLIKIYKIEEK